MVRARSNRHLFNSLTQIHFFGRPPITLQGCMPRKYTDESLRHHLPNCGSIRQLILALRLNESGSMYASLKKRITDLDLDTSHMHGQGWLKGGVPQNAQPLKDILKKGTTYRSSYLKPRLFKAKLFEERCSVCGLDPVWRDQPLVLELDHINGDRFDNRIENLRIICPNCHSQTPTFRGRKKQASVAER